MGTIWGERRQVGRGLTLLFQGSLGREPDVNPSATGSR